MLEKAIKVLEKYRGKRLAAGISGGADSMCLLWLLLSCSFFDKNDITVLHIDHNLRPTSIRDRKLVEEFCAQNGVKIEVLSVDVSNAAKTNKRSIETEARLIRHKLFKDFCDKADANLALAHTKDDQAETILMHIFRGCGLNGLTGMSECDGHIIRPLIYNLKSEIYAFNAKNDIPFFEDETNKEIKYSRNYIRGLLKSAETVYPAAKDNIALLGEIAKDANNILLSGLNESCFSTDGEVILLNKTALKTPLVAYYIMQAAKKAGLLCDLEYKHVNAVQALSDKRVGAQIDLPHGLMVYVEREHIAFSFTSVILNAVKDPPHGAENGAPAEIPFKEGINILDGIKITALAAENKIQKGSIIVDADCLKDSVLRFRREGDRFCPCGGKSKKLKEYLNEKHIPNRKKSSLPLICRDNEVLVIVGIELNDKVKLTDKTLRAWHITEI